MNKKNCKLERVLTEMAMTAKKAKWLDISKAFSEYGVKLDPENVSDGYHTFKDLYNQRLHLSAALANAYPNQAWKSKFDENGKPWFGGGWFLVCFDTPKGQYSYHYELEYWDLFNCGVRSQAEPFDGHTSKDVSRLDSISWDVPNEYIDREIKLAIDAEAKEAGVNPEEQEDDIAHGYAMMCFRSAKKAYLSLCEAGHSGMSIGFTKNILNRFIDHKPLTPLEDKEDQWGELIAGETRSWRHHKRYTGLTKGVNAKTGAVVYSDLHRVVCVDKNTDATFGWGYLTRLIDEMYPIEMPYMPADKPFKVIVEDFLCDPNKGDYDHVGVFDILMPDGTKKEVNKFYEENSRGELVEISKDKYEKDRETGLTADAFE